MPESRYLRVRNFDKFQRYSRENLKQNPNPHWIKVYYALLADRMFYRLPDASKFHVVGLFLMASQYDNKIPCDLEWLEHQLGATSKIDLAALLESRFVEWVEPEGPATPAVTEIIAKVKKLVTPLDPRKSVIGDNQIRKEEIREEEKREEKNGKGSGETARKSRAPAELPVSTSMAQWAYENGITVDLGVETAAMLDHHRGKGNLHLDWIATWRTWMRRTKKYGGTNGNGRPKSKADIVRENCESVLALTDSETGGSGECGN